MRPVFADPKTDFVFKKLFGTEEHKPLLLALLNHLLETDEPHRIVALTFLPPDQRPAVEEMKMSIVDVKCVDAQGTRYVVEMQVLNVEGFEKRVVYNASKAYTAQLGSGERYPALDDVVAVSICDFLLWPAVEGQPSAVPMLSRWRMQEQHGGARGLSQVQYVFLELPKYAAQDQPRTVGEKWAYFFHAAEDLSLVPAALVGQPMGEALEVARTAHFSAQEWEAYDRAKVAEQDARGALSLAHKSGLREGREDGLRQGLRLAIEDLCEALGVALGEEQRAELAALDTDGLEARRLQIKRDRRWA